MNLKTVKRTVTKTPWRELNKLVFQRACKTAIIPPLLVFHSCSQKTFTYPVRRRSVFSPMADATLPNTFKTLVWVILRLLIRRRISDSNIIFLNRIKKVNLLKTELL